MFVLLQCAVHAFVAKTVIADSRVDATEGDSSSQDGGIGTSSHECDEVFSMLFNPLDLLEQELVVRVCGGNSRGMFVDDID